VSNNRPLVRIDTATDNLPVIIERPADFPFLSGERDDYREATDEEYGRYADWYNVARHEPTD